MKEFQPDQHHKDQVRVDRYENRQYQINHNDIKNLRESKKQSDLKFSRIEQFLLDSSNIEEYKKKETEIFEFLKQLANMEQGLRWG